MERLGPNTDLAQYLRDWCRRLRIRHVPESEWVTRPGEIVPDAVHRICQTEQTLWSGPCFYIGAPDPDDADSELRVDIVCFRGSYDIRQKLKAKGFQYRHGQVPQPYAERMGWSVDEDLGHRPGWRITVGCYDPVAVEIYRWIVSEGWTIVSAGAWIEHTEHTEDK